MILGRGSSQFRSVAVVLPLLMLLGAGAAQAQRGAITGLVVDQVTRSPIEAVRVQIEGAVVAATTNQAGRFVIRGVAPGPHVVRVGRIGYRPTSATVTVRANDSVYVELAMSASAVQLAAVVSTGTGGAIEKERVGSSMGIVDYLQVKEQLPVGDLLSSLASKITGVRSEGVGGGAGGQRDIRIRGIASFSLDQRPTIYIDGVRIDKSRDEWTTSTGAGGVACCSFAGGNAVDRLNDLNPDDIERIEVLKGAAAATLYGSDATNGVIQIFTKRGKSESVPVFSVSYTGGFDRLRDNLPTKLYPNFVGPDGTRARDANSLIRSGAYSNMDVSVQGGGTRNTYFISTGYLDQEGSIQPNWERRNNMRINLTFIPTDKWTVEARSIFTRNKIAELQAGNNWTALLGNAMNGDPRKVTKERPFGEAWVSVSDVEKIQSTSDANRWTGGLTLNYAQLSNLSHRLVIGLDAVNEQKSRFFPWEGNYGPAGVTSGQKNEGYRKYSNFTVDYLTTWRQKLTSSLSSDFSFGGQGYFEKTDVNLSTGNTFAGPGVNLVAAASVKSGGQGFSESINIGALAQERLSFQDRLFVTLGLRIDGNSAFGNNYGFNQYPKADFAWLLSKYSWFPTSIASNFKLRGAIGYAGKAPGAFDKFTTFGPVSVYGGTPAVVPLNPGNQDIRPETTVEKEIGFEAGFLNDRIGVDASYYYQTVKDALLNLSNPPSAGFSQSKRVNLGAIQNTGWEASFNFLVTSRKSLDWTTSLRLDGNHNKIVSMGVVPQTGSTRVGYPIAGVWGRVFTNYANVNGVPTFTRTDTNVYVGPALPTFNAALTNTVRWKRLTAYWNVTMERGAFLSNGDRSYRVRQGGSDEFLKLLTVDPKTGAWSKTFASDSAYNWWVVGDSFDPRDNFRFREASLSWDVPEALTVPRKMGKMSVTVSGQNIMWWDHCNCSDPNMAYQGGTSFGIASGFLAQPSPRQFRVAIRSRF